MCPTNEVGGAIEPVGLPSATGHLSGARRTALGVLVLAAATFIAYYPALRAGYVWDDDHHVTDNRNIKSPDGLSRTWLDARANPQYYPLVFTTFWLEYRLWRLHPFGYHAVNVLLHTTSAILLWRILRRLDVPGSWFAAALFALHPVQVESVAWITERKNVLSCVFFLSALMSFLRFAGLDQPAQRLRWGWYVLSLLFFICALFSKTITCSLPAALLLLIWWKHGRWRMAELLPLIPMIVIGLAMARVTCWVEKHHVGSETLELGLTPVGRLLLAGRAIWFYLSKLIWPANLTFVYPKWEINPHAMVQYVCPIGVLAAIAVLWLMRRRVGRGPPVAALLYVGTLMPALGFIDVYPFRYSWVADHFQYLACIAPIAAFAAAFFGLSRPAAAGNESSRPAARTFQIALLLVLATLTWRQCSSYRDAKTLWRATIARNDRAWIAHNNLGSLLAFEGQFDEARAHLERSMELNATATQTLSNLAYLHTTRGEYELAMDCCRRALKLKNPDVVGIYNNMGIILLHQNKPEESALCLRRCLENRDDFLPARINLAKSLFRLGRPDEACRELDAATVLDPDEPEPHILKAEYALRTGRALEAAQSLQAALHLAPDHIQARYNLAMVLGGLHRFDEAIGHIRRAIVLRPDFADAHNVCASLLLQQGDLRGAADEFRMAIKLNPDLIEARFNFANVLAGLGDDDAALNEVREVLRRAPDDVEAKALFQEISRRASSRPSG